MDNEEDAVDQAAMLDESQLLDNSFLFENFEANQAGTRKKRVVPMNN